MGGIHRVGSDACLRAKITLSFAALVVASLIGCEADGVRPSGTATLADESTLYVAEVRSGGLAATFLFGPELEACAFSRPAEAEAIRLTVPADSFAVGSVNTDEGVELTWVNGPNGLLTGESVTVTLSSVTDEGAWGTVEAHLSDGSELEIVFEAIACSS